MLFVVMCCLLMATVVCHRAAAHAPLFRHVFAASVAGLFLLLGATLYIIRYNNVVASIDVQQTSFCGTVTGMPQPKPRTVAVQVRLDDGGLMLAYVQSDTAHSPHQLQTGDTLFFSPLHVNSTCPLTLSDTSVFRNYNSNLFFRGIAATCYVPSDRWTHTSPAQRDATWNERLHRYYAQSPLDSVTASMVEALTIGRREGLSRQLRADYSTAGVSHVLALSGMHLHLLIALLNLLIFSFLSYGHRRFAMLAVIPLLWMFTYVAGAPPSLVRAAVMATFLQIGFACGRVYFVLNALALAAIVMLTYDPLVLHNVGFQLSFLSMLGVALLFKQFYLSTSPSAEATMSAARGLPFRPTACVRAADQPHRAVPHVAADVRLRGMAAAVFLACGTGCGGDLARCPCQWAEHGGRDHRLVACLPHRLPSQCPRHTAALCRFVFRPLFFSPTKITCLSSRARVKV